MFPYTVSDNAHAVSMCNRRFVHLYILHYYYYVFYVKTRFVEQREFRLGFTFLAHSIINSTYRAARALVL